jgi:viroplasmin and RNaseH domain-containing protein
MKLGFYTLLLTLTINNLFAAVSIENHFENVFGNLINQENENILPNPTTEKTLVKTFNIKDNTFIILNFDGNIEVKEWAETTVRVHANVALVNGNVNMLKYLVSEGRYNLSLENINSGVQISSPGRNQDVVINKSGDILNEKITYTVFVPRGVKGKGINNESEHIAIVK